QVITEFQKSLSDPLTHAYCVSDFGTPELRAALLEKVQKENHLRDREIMVTAGANQAFLNVALACCDVGDEAIIFSPYYFNHLMTLQMCGIVPVIVKCDEKDFQPPIDQIEKYITQKTRMIILTSPNNPTGVVVPQEKVEKLSKICESKKIWLISDETYEYFVYDGAKHYSPKGDHVINIYSFSKCYGMAGWRVGYIAYPSKNKDLEKHLVKVQDAVPISCAVSSQILALAALKEAGKEFCLKQVEKLNEHRKYVWEAIRKYSASSVKPNGAIYFYVMLPEKYKEQ